MDHSISWVIRVQIAETSDTHVNIIPHIWYYQMRKTPYIGTLINLTSRNVSYTEEVVGSSPIPPTITFAKPLQNRAVTRFFRYIFLAEWFIAHFPLHIKGSWVIRVQSDCSLSI